MKTDTLLNGMVYLVGGTAEFIKYTSLLYGIANIVGDEPNFGIVASTGFSYVVFDFLAHKFKNFHSDRSIESLEMHLDAHSEVVCNALDDIKKKLDSVQKRLEDVEE